MPKCAPVLLEPIMAVEIAVPSEATARINGIISQRRGQILGFDAREGWSGWDVVQAQMPASEMESLIVDLRSATSGVGTYTGEVRSPGRAHRAPRRPGARRAQAGGGVRCQPQRAQCVPLPR